MLSETVLSSQSAPSPTPAGLPLQEVVKGDTMTRGLAWVEPQVPHQEDLSSKVPSHQLPTNNKILSQKQNTSKENNSLFRNSHSLCGRLSRFFVSLSVSHTHTHTQTHIYAL